MVICYIRPMVIYYDQNDQITTKMTKSPPPRWRHLQGLGRPVEPRFPSQVEVSPLLFAGEGDRGVLYFPVGVRGFSAHLPYSESCRDRSPRGPIAGQHEGHDSCREFRGQRPNLGLRFGEHSKG